MFLIVYAAPRLAASRVETLWRQADTATGTLDWSALPLLPALLDAGAAKRKGDATMLTVDEETTRSLCLVSTLIPTVRTGVASILLSAAAV